MAVIVDPNKYEYMYIFIYIYIYIYLSECASASTAAPSFIEKLISKIRENKTRVFSTKKTLKSKSSVLL